MTHPVTVKKPWRRSLRKVNREPAPWVYHLIGRLAQAGVPVFARLTWAGQEHIPQRGAVIIVANHISNFDPIVLGQYLIWSGRWPRFLGKSQIFKTPVLGWVARQCEQIPVHRGTSRAGDSLVHATEALGKGHAVAIYPEGTITGDPDTWPMTGRRGAARLWLSSGVPVVPVAQVGANQILGQKTIEWRRIFGRRREVSVVAGPPIDLSRFEGMKPTNDVLDEMTDHIIDVLTSMVADLRGEQPPEGRFDLRVGSRVPKRQWGAE